MIGLGLDLVDVDRFRRVLHRRPGVARRLFTDGERAISAIESLAARFAAKEATLKALKIGAGAVSWRDIEVVRTESGAPGLALHGQAAALAASRGIQRWHLSLTHTDHSAAAVVVAS